MAMHTSTNGDGPTVRLTIPARAEYITLCRLALTGIARVRALSDELLADLKLALTEAASNSVRQAYSAPEELSEGGLGIAIIKAIADAVEIGKQPGGKGSRLRFEKALS